MEENYIQFFTATILNWNNLLKSNKYKDIIIQSMKFLVDKNKVKIYGFVIMPNHIHIIWQIERNNKREEVQRDFLKYTAQQIKFDLLKNDPIYLKNFEVNLKDRRYQFWKRNPLSIDIYSREILEQKLIYIHNNPLQEKWQLVESVDEYSYSSASFYLSNDTKYDFITNYYDCI